MIAKIFVLVLGLLLSGVASSDAILSHNGFPFVSLIVLILEVEEFSQRSKTFTRSEREPFNFIADDSAVTVNDRRRAVIEPPLELYQSYPNELEYNVVGPVVNPIYLNTPAFTALQDNVCHCCAYLTQP